MLPNHPLLHRAELHSASGGTTFDPTTFVLRYGLGRIARVEGAGGEASEQFVTVSDRGMLTAFHEGLHWRQLCGTTLGAFLLWLKHAREIELFQKLNELPEAVRRKLLDARFAGRPMIALNDDGLPDPPIDLSSGDPVELIRCVWFDNYIVETLFLDAERIVKPHAEMADILASVMADAATGMAPHHPSWDGLAYRTIQAAFTLPKEEVVRVQFSDRSALEEQFTARELTVEHILEAGATVNELLLESLTMADTFHTERGALTSLAAADFDPARARDKAHELLWSGHGMAARYFFTTSRLDPEIFRNWHVLAAVADFALNPPLPPLVGLSTEPRPWRDLYPPLRFALAAKACAHFGLEATTHEGIVHFYAALAEATGLTAPPLKDTTPVRDNLPDFGAIVADEREEELYRGPITYYDFARWCQVRLWQARAEDVRLLALPGLVAVDLLHNDHNRLWRLLYGLYMAAPLVTDDEGHLDHPVGSTVAFGTWLALSVLTCGLTQDLAFGSGLPSRMGLPPTLFENKGTTEIVRGAIESMIGTDPWAGAGVEPNWAQ